jgi:hypothetical protein
VSFGRLLSFTASASDQDLPANTLIFSLDAGAPDGAAIDPVTGHVTWTPMSPQTPGDYSLTVRVTDDGVPPLSDFETIQIHVSSTWQNPLDRLDISGGGGVVPLDALLIINEINNRSISNRTTGRLPDLPVGVNPPPYLDANGDGFVFPLDVLLVINELNKSKHGEGETAAAETADAAPPHHLTDLALLSLVEEFESTWGKSKRRVG